ncbi:MAG: T9SS C-terminal target domain-containing protein, partial [Bacteroidetes bacterium]
GPFIALDSLNPCVDYDFYVYSVCGQDSVSLPGGPATFTTTWSDNPVSGSCEYTLVMHSESGFGWSGADLIVSVGNVTQTVDFFFGFDQTVTITAGANEIITIEFESGFNDAEISYELMDDSGLVLFADGPSPQIGEVFQFAACATCNIPARFRMADINADNAKVIWDLGLVPWGDFVIEYGPLGFYKGTGTVLTVDSLVTEATLTNLSENTWYDVYIQSICDTVNVSKPIGPISFKTLFFNDVGVVGVSNPSNANCSFSSDEKPEILIRNFGQLPQTLFNFRYAVNGQVAPIPIPTDGFYTGVIGNDSIQYIQFETGYDFSEPGFYLIEAWTELETDGNPANDTFALGFITSYPKPLYEDFESGDFPDSWTSTQPNVFAPLAHGNLTSVTGVNLYSGNASWQMTTHRVGKIELGDVLFFDYRFVDWPGGLVPKEMTGGDSLVVEVSTDCGETFEPFFVIDSLNHTPSAIMKNIALNLNAFAGESVEFRFRGVWGGGDYWLDMDNINLPGCPENFGVYANSTIKPATSGMANGYIEVVPLFGTAPYEYLWEDGSQTNIRTNLPPGIYTVTITDAMGCVGTETFNVGLVVSAEEVARVEQMTLFPNPTDGRVTLELRLSQPTDLTLQVFDANGRIAWTQGRPHVAETREEIDLSALPDGIYFLRVITPDGSDYRKIMLAR